MNFTNWHSFFGVASLRNEAEALFEAPEVLFASMGTFVRAQFGGTVPFPESSVRGRPASFPLPLQHGFFFKVPFCFSAQASLHKKTRETLVVNKLRDLEKMG